MAERDRDREGERERETRVRAHTHIPARAHRWHGVYYGSSFLQSLAVCFGGMFECVVFWRFNFSFLECLV